MFRKSVFHPVLGILAIAGVCALWHPSLALAEPQQPKATAICTPVSVASFSSRVHVRCSVAVSGILYFAQSTADSGAAARTQALLMTAMAAGRDLRIYYEPTDLSGSAIGCQNADCRLIQAAELL